MKFTLILILVVMVRELFSLREWKDLSLRQRYLLLKLVLYWNSGIFGKKDLGTKKYCISLFPFLLLPAVLFEQNQICPLDVLIVG